MLATVTKKQVTKITDIDYSIIIHVVITNDIGDEIFLESDYEERYNSSVSISEIQTKLQNKIAADWNKYLVQKAIYDDAGFDTLVSSIQSAANTYINK